MSDFSIQFQFFIIISHILSGIYYFKVFNENQILAEGTFIFNKPNN
jgi:hypothetical protein